MYANTKKEKRWDNCSYIQDENGGLSNNLYFEDNLFTGIKPLDKTYALLADGQFNGRYVFRYNTITLERDAFPLLDMHGNQSSGGKSGRLSGIYSCFGAEIYGNLIKSGTHNLCFFDQRGGKVLVFFNKFEGNGSISTKVREEYNDAEEPDDNSQPQHVSDSYYWHNMKSNNEYINPYVSQSLDYGSSLGLVPQENRDFWYEVKTFDGSSGIGCGPISRRPEAIVSGAAYWATDQDCAVINDVYVGVDPEIPIDGILYRVSDSGEWIEYYKPLIYHHPLRVSGPVADK